MKFFNEKILEIGKSVDYTNATVGIVAKTAEDLKDSTKLGLFIPKLQLGIDYSNGASESNESISYSKIKNNENSNIGSGSVKTRNYFIVSGISIPNATMPAFAIGEHLLVNCLDSDIKTLYFQSQTFVNPGKRSSDRYRVGAIAPVKEKPNTDLESSRDNYYAIEFDTKNQSITIQNSISNGEQFQYTLLIDAKNGTFSIADSKRLITINSNDDRITLQNEADSIITMVEDQINVKCKKFTLEAEDEINIKTKKYTLETNDFSETSKSATIEHKSAEITHSTLKLTADMFEQKSNTYKLSVPVEDHDNTALMSSGMVVATGMQMGPSPPSPSMIPPVPKGSSVSECGNTDIKVGTQKTNSSSGAVPLTKATDLQNIIIALCVEIDKAQAAGGIPPLCSATVAPRVATFASISTMSS